MEQKQAPTTPPDHQLPSTTARPAEPPKRKKRRQWLWILILLAIFAVIFYFVLHKSSTTKTAAPAGRRGAMGGPVTLTVATAKQGDIGIYLNEIGIVTPVNTATIYNQVAGVITAVHYREGQMVRKGDPLVDIDPRQYEANVATAAGNLERDRTCWRRRRWT